MQANKILGFTKIKDKMLVCMAQYIFQGTRAHLHEFKEKTYPEFYNF